MSKLTPLEGEMLAALKLALEYWADRQQRYRNRSPVWVEHARAAISKSTAGIDGDRMNSPSSATPSSALRDRPDSQGGEL